jgi:bifunctional ADP-heptose synthase (sugar kinase/adenylyltransferase)
VRIGHDDERLLAAGRNILERMKLQSLVVTRGRDGLVTFARRRVPVFVPIHGSDEVADVTGAGDTVIAAYTAALAAGADAESAARIANVAGGIVVMKRGTATASNDELFQAMTQAK